MSDVVLAELRQDAYSLVDKMSEETLVFLLKVMHGLADDTVPSKRTQPKRKPGIAQGKFVCPDDIDADNEMIANMFEGNV